MRCYRIAVATLFATVAVAPAAVQACTLADDYRVPTNLKLAGQSELILRGRVIGEVEGDRARDSTLLVEPIETLKGSMPSGTVEIAGVGLIPTTDERGLGLLSNPYQLEGAHPLSYIGGCIRYMFPEGTTALFFLDRHDGKWLPAGGAFSRWAEDVLEENAPWMKLARFYATIPLEDAERRKAMLEAERDRLLAQSGDLVATLMAQDIERQLSDPNEAWNEIMHKAIDGESEVPAGAAPEAAAAAVASLLTDGESENGDKADEMEDAALLLCDLAADKQSVNCDGVTYSKTDEISDPTD